MWGPGPCCARSAGGHVDASAPEEPAGRGKRDGGLTAAHQPFQRLPPASLCPRPWAPQCLCPLTLSGLPANQLTAVAPLPEPAFQHHLRSASETLLTPSLYPAGCEPLASLCSPLEGLWTQSVLVNQTSCNVALSLVHSASLDGLSRPRPAGNAELTCFH